MPDNIVTEYINTGLRSIAASVPVAASFSQAWNEYETNRRFRRLDKSFDYLKDKIESRNDQISEEIIQYIQDSGEFSEIIERVFQKVQHTHSDEKIKAFISILVNSAIVNTTVNINDKLSVVESLDSINERDMLVLSLFQSGRIYRVDEIHQRNIFNISNQDERLGVLINSLSKLESRGLIGETARDTSDVIGGVGNMNSWFNRWRSKYYEILPFGTLFIKLLKE